MNQLLARLELPDDASPLAHCLVREPDAYPSGGEPEWFRKLGGGALGWEGIVRLIEGGQLRGRADESFAHPRLKETLGVLRMAMSWLDHDVPRNNIHKSTNHTRGGVEKVALALLDKGFTPISQEEEEILLKMALRGGSLNLFKRLYDRAESTSRIGIEKWLAAGHAFEGGNGSHLLARMGHVNIVEHLLDTDIIQVNQQDNKGRTIAFSAQHSLMVAMLARRGLDPSLSDKQGRQASEAWVHEVQRTQSLIGMRKTWYRHFSMHAGVVSHANLARQCLSASLLSATTELLVFDRLLTADSKGKVDGRSLPEMVARNAAMPPAVKPRRTGVTTSAETVREAWMGIRFDDPTSCGVSEGFHYAMANFGEHGKWKELQTQAYRQCAERYQPLEKQREALHRLAQVWTEDHPEQTLATYERLVGRWWKLREDVIPHNEHGDSETLYFLDQPDPLHPQGRSLVELVSQGGVWRNYLTNYFGGGSGVMAHLARDTAHPQAWMEFALHRLPNETGLGKEDESQHFLPLLGFPSPPVSTVLLARLMDLGVQPNPDRMRDYPKEHVAQIAQKWPQFNAHVEAWVVDAHTPKAEFVSKSRRI